MRKERKHWVLGQEGLLSRWKGRPSRKGSGFEQPPHAHQHWHMDVSRFRVTQEHVIEPDSLEGKPGYSRRGKGLSGAEVWLECDGGKFASGMTKVEVTAPDQQSVVAEFNLEKLK
jgi:hypothetical protein